ncbi:tRNA-dihydrouridine(16/17) synthase [NAD(P)(+)] [Cytospora mali]|uniref:tRNA-dihydrouridine(16/17) synthase [NAD(P)(+)] n=1 Tax=Cytospora mali TaxID=578113 RepID=A0A194V6S7_CYTMA|nr:tRNA-dihydrouridine(16/17) synthase [NAD(P)(+)] [Valsa mali var. pyri (nom. inval.)]
MATEETAPAAAGAAAAARPAKLHGRAFYESIGSPKYIVAPMFCANDPQALLSAALLAAPHCDAVDLNLGCPQGIARKGHYGAFLQEDQALIHDMIRTLHEGLPVPVTAKIRILDTREATLAYARNVLGAGASILTVHGRRREQKGHLTGVADWAYIRYLRENLPPETVIFANGNILQHGDLQRCLDATGADAVMSAEGNLSDPALFAEPPAPGTETREYWRGKDGRGGWRVDAVLRRYLDIVHRYVLGQEPPARRPLFVPGDDEAWLEEQEVKEKEAEEPAKKKRRREGGGGGGAKEARMTSITAGPNFGGMQAHIFHMLRHFVTRHHDVRDALAKSRLGNIAAHESILDIVERKVAEGLLEYERTGGKSVENDGRNGAYEKGSRNESSDVPTAAVSEAEVEAEAQKQGEPEAEGEIIDDPNSSVATVKRCKRPWWVVQPIIRPLPAEAMAKGAISLSKKEKQKMEEGAEKKEKTESVQAPAAVAQTNGDGAKGEATETLEKKTSFPETDLVSG